MINATYGEGFGLTPFECALSGVLTIMPNNTSFTSLVENEKVPNYLLPCYYVPYDYARLTQNFSLFSKGGTVYCFHYESKSIEESQEYCDLFIPITENIKTYVAQD